MHPDPCILMITEGPQALLAPLFLMIPKPLLLFLYSLVIS